MVINQLADNSALLYTRASSDQPDQSSSSFRELFAQYPVDRYESLYSQRNEAYHDAYPVESTPSHRIPQKSEEHESARAYTLAPAHEPEDDGAVQARDSHEQDTNRAQADNPPKDTDELSGSRSRAEGDTDTRAEKSARVEKNEEHTATAARAVAHPGTAGDAIENASHLSKAPIVDADASPEGSAADAISKSRSPSAHVDERLDAEHASESKAAPIRFTDGDLLEQGDRAIAARSSLLRKERLPDSEDSSSDISTPMRAVHLKNARATNVAERNASHQGGDQSHAQQHSRAAEQVRVSVVDRALHNPQGVDGAPARTLDTLPHKTVQEFRNFLAQDSSSTIVKHARFVFHNAQESEVRLLLRPAELGTMRLKLFMQDNAVHGKILVDSAFAKDVVENGIVDIQRMLKNQGIQGGVIDVNVSSRSPHHAQTPFFHEERAITYEKAHIAPIIPQNSDIYLESVLINVYA